MSELAQQPTTHTGVAAELRARFEPECLYQETVDGIATLWVSRNRLLDVMRFLKNEIIIKAIH